jgi:hypothetical protein
MTEKQLKSLYKRYNRKYFDGSLPADIPLKFENMSATTHCGLTTMFASEGLFLPVIYLDSTFKEYEPLTKISLLHEMTHIKLHPRALEDAHGQAFDEEMMRLAFRGAFHGLW